MPYIQLTPFASSGLVSKTFMNNLIGNIDHFRTPPQYVYTASAAGSNYTTTNTARNYVDQTNMNPTLQLTGNPVLVGFHAGRQTVGGVTYFNFAVDGNVVFNSTNELAYVAVSNIPVDIQWIIMGVTPGSHAISVLWKTSAGTATLYADSGIQFYVREL